MGALFQVLAILAPGKPVPPAPAGAVPSPGSILIFQELPFRAATAFILSYDPQYSGNLGPHGESKSGLFTRPSPGL